MLMIVFILVVQNHAPKKFTCIDVITPETHYVFMYVSDHLQAFRVIKTFKPDCFLLEEHLPRMSGSHLSLSLHARRGLEWIPAIIFPSCHRDTAPENHRHLSHSSLLSNPYLEKLLKIIDMMLLFSGTLLLYSFSEPNALQ
jgi:hypothetical protein